MGIRRASWALVAVLIVMVAAGAAAGGHSDFAAQVPRIPGKSWTDLLRQVFPDIAETDKGDVQASKIIDLRSIGAGDDSWVQCGHKIDLRDRDVRPIRLGGGDLFIVTVDIPDDCVGLLALFDADGKLVDAVNIKGDQHVSFSGDYVRPLGRDAALVLPSLWHDNSSQSYDITSLVLARPGGLSSIGDVLALGSRICGEHGKPGEQILEESKVRVVPDGHPLARIEVEVKRSIQKLDGEDCQTKIGRETRTTFNGYWRWNAKKNAYEAHTNELDRLAAWNQGHF